MEWVETTGRSLEEAKEAALDQLGVDEVDAEFEVIEEPRAGLFGRVRGEARVRARVRPTVPRPKEDRRDRRRRGRAGGDGARGESGGSIAVAESDDGQGGRSQGRADRAGGAPSGDAPAGAEDSATPSDRSASNGESVGGTSAGTSAATGPSASGQAGSPEGAKRRRKRRRGGRSSAAKRATSPAGTGGSADSGQPGVVASPPSVPAAQAGVPAGEVVSSAVGGSGRAEGQVVEQGHSNNGRGETAVEVSLEEQGRIAEEFLKGLVSEFGVDAAVKITVSGDEEVKLDLSGSDLGLLIGPKGTTLLALQDLTRTAVHHQTGATNGRILVDVGAYRQKRSEALARFAQQVAAKVKETGSATALEPMSAPDRKVVHDAVTDVDGVSTFSEGEEPRRRVVITPASAPES